LAEFDSYTSLGWHLFPAAPELLLWAKYAAPIAQKIARDPAQRAKWLRSGGTWFVGVNALSNDAEGRLPGGPPLAGAARRFVEAHISAKSFDWDRAQISVCTRGYPQPSAEESSAAFRFRRDRDAAHVDGLLPVGPKRRRYWQETHRFILGVPLNDAGPHAAPFVVWERSHQIIAAAFSKALRPHPPKHWSDIDLTEIYQKARQEVFDRCKRVEISAKPGQSYISHPLAVHGVAPWPEHLSGPAQGRMIAYFRPNMTADEALPLLT